MKSTKSTKHFTITAVLLIVVFIALLTTASFAVNPTDPEYVSPDEAKTIAASQLKLSSQRDEIKKVYSEFFSGNSVSDTGTMKELKDAEGNLIAYVFELNPTGYIVVPAHKALSPVIAYSYGSKFSWSESNQNLLLIMLKGDISRRIAAFDKGVLSSKTIEKNRTERTALIEGTKTLSRTRTVTGPLMTFTSWSQNPPYNAYCPMDPSTGERSVVGCVATASAQIMNYWNYPTSIIFSDEDSYVTETRNIAIDAPAASVTGIDYNSQYPTDDTKARLSYACGVMVKMDYASDGSGASTYDAYEALKVLGFGNAEFIYDFPTDEIRTDVLSGRPLIIAIRNETVAHALILDGYDDETGMYHLNFGWAGSTDGWYVIPTGLPDPFTTVRYVVVKIYPAGVPTPTPTPSPDPTPTGTTSGGSGGGGCFIATAAYGSYLDKDVVVLRNFRDDVLMKSEPGRKFVETYYKNSPPAADYISKRPALRSATRFALTPLVLSVKYPVPSIILAFLIMAAIITVVKKRMRKNEA